MDDLDARLAALLHVPDRAPDIGFTNTVSLRIDMERKLAERLAAERLRTVTLLAATLAVATGLWLFAQGSAFATVFGAVGDGAGLAAVAAVMLLWIGTGGAGSLAGD